MIWTFRHYQNLLLDGIATHPQHAIPTRRQHPLSGWHKMRNQESDYLNFRRWRRKLIHAVRRCPRFVDALGRRDNGRSNPLEKSGKRRMVCRRKFHDAFRRNPVKQILVCARTCGTTDRSTPFAGMEFSNAIRRVIGGNSIRQDEHHRTPVAFLGFRSLCDFAVTAFADELQRLTKNRATASRDFRELECAEFCERSNLLCAAAERYDAQVGGFKCLRVFSQSRDKHLETVLNGFNRFAMHRSRHINKQVHRQSSHYCFSFFVCSFTSTFACR